MFQMSRSCAVLAVLTVVGAGCYVPPSLCDADVECGEGAACINGSCRTQTAPVDPTEDPVLVGVDPRWTVEVPFEGGATEPTLALIGAGQPSIAFFAPAHPPGVSDFQVMPTVVKRAGESGSASWRTDSMQPHSVDILYSQFGHLDGAGGEQFLLGTWNSAQFTEFTAGVFDRYELIARNHGGRRHLHAVMAPDGAVHGLVLDKGAVSAFTWDGDRSRLDVDVSPLVQLCPEGANECTGSAGLEIAVDEDASPVALYGNSTGTTLATRSGAQWQLEPLPSTVKPGALTLSPTGDPTVCFAEEGAVLGSSTIRCMRRRGGQWSSLDLRVNQRNTHAWIQETHEAATGELTVLYAEAVIDMNGQSSEQSLSLARWDGTSWTTVPVFAHSGPDSLVWGHVADMFVAADGEVHLAVALDRLYYMRGSAF